MLPKCLFICYSTENYRPLTSLCLQSLKRIGVNRIQHKIENPVDLITSGGEGFRTNIWYYCVLNKIKHLVDVLKKNRGSKSIPYFIFTDCDIIYYKKNKVQWKNLESFILKHNDKDIFFLKEGEGNTANTGFFIIKNNQNIQKIIHFFESVIIEMGLTSKDDMYLGDQTIINKNIHKIRYGYVPVEYVALGTSIHNKDKVLFHHAVCTYNKIEQIEYIRSQIGSD